MDEIKGEVLEAENRHLREEIEKLETMLKARDLRIAGLNGQIRGLEFALRCNGIAGAEVR